jgi:phosphohistidine swiveling domain-containing protein
MIATKKIPSITEWLSEINYKQLDLFRREDSEKRDRLELLNQTIGLPYLKAYKFAPKEIINESARFKKFLSQSGNTKFLFKLLPTLHQLTKLRIRNKNLKNCVQWFKAQKINPDNYKIEIVPIDNNEKLSAVFCCNENGIWGEIIDGPIWNFSKGTYKKRPIIFSFDFKNWYFSSHQKSAENFIKQAIEKIKIEKVHQIKYLKNKLGIEIAAQKYLQGYFECVERSGRLLFVDYNRCLFKIIKKSLTTISHGINLLHGICLGPGKATGKAVIIKNQNKKIRFPKNYIIVCRTANFELLPYLKKSAGIITEQGAILSHAAIVCRELKVPFVAHVKNATEKIKNGQKIFIDADKGIVKIVK